MSHQHPLWVPGSSSPPERYRQLPGGWHPRDFQKPLWGYLRGGGKRAVAIWHRRAGKDEVMLQWTGLAAMTQRIGNYWHMLPEAAQARKAIWAAVNPHTGRRRIDEAFPEEYRAATRTNEMSIEFINGSTWQVVGSDNYNSLVGSPPIGLVFSEFAIADPSAWAYLRPILRENDGWAVFITTPRGRNHAATFYEAAKRDPTWFAELLPATKTPVFTPEQLDIELAELVREYGKEEGESRFNQEYLCSFAAGVIGSYYGNAMERLEAAGRIGNVAWLPNLPVHTGWDLGRRDDTVIWFFQLVGTEVHFIDYLQSNGSDISWYAKELDKKPYKFGTHCLPHDADSEHLAADKTIAGSLRMLGYRDQRIVPRPADVNHAINAGRMILPRCRFDRERCERGIAALQNYRRAWDEKNRVFNDKPLHDWASHGADGFRTAAVAIADGLQNPGASKKLVYPKLGIA
jgi:phage terminase large subunit